MAELLKVERIPVRDLQEGMKIINVGQVAKLEESENTITIYTRHTGYQSNEEPPSIRYSPIARVYVQIDD